MATNDKYDRQLRLWGAAGQRALLNSHILLISADGAGSETLKNLVLPGIGAFTILDDHRVSASDLSSNFFVTEDSIGKNRGEVVAENLCEMNPDVKGYATVGNYRNLLRSEPTFFDPFNLIIASNIPTALLLPLAERCWDRDVPLILVRSYGMIGTVRIQTKEHFIADHRRENALFDLRLASPFSSLKFASEALKAEYPSLNSSEKKHVPYIFLLLWALDEWRLQKSSALGSNDGRNTNEAESRVPVTLDEKNEFRALLKTSILEKWSLGATTGGDPASDGSSEADGAFASPAGMNGEEAMREAHRVFSDKALTPEIVDFIDILNSKDDLSDERNRPLRIQFHRRLLRTLSTFMQQEGFRLPLPGAVPDLTATSTRYLQLQHIYHEQASRDCEVFVRLLRAREVEEQVPPECVVPQDEAVSFCKSVLVTSLLSTTQVLHEENGELFANFGEHLINDVIDEDPLQTPLSWALAIRACDVFFMQQGRYPGDDFLQAQKAVNDENWKTEDAEKVWAILKDLAGKCNACIATEDETQEKMDEENTEESYKPPATISKFTAIEITRYGAAELHPISALVGGVAAQEAVKLITGQYVPLDGLFVYNGISSIGGTYSLKG